MSEKKLKTISVTSEKLEVSGVSHSNRGGKKAFIEPELREYPSLKEVTLLTVPAVSGATFFKTFK